MEKIQNSPALLILEDGTVFNGKAIGTIGTTTGEIAFNTGMTGYQEIFTDPSYYGQILIMASSHIGNYGVHKEDSESEGIKLSGLVTKKFSKIQSRVGSSGDTQSFLKSDRLVGICDVDTRRLVRHIRSKGAMNAIISSEITDINRLTELVKATPSMQGLELSTKVSTSESYEVGDITSEFRIALLDLGVKRSIVKCLNERGCLVKVFPLHSSAKDILDWNPDGIMFSNGPGDPSAMTETISVTKDLISSGIVCFGICLGHQIIALSQGLVTKKMFNGHRGINHPVKNLITGNSEITSQNHGFVVTNESIDMSDELELTHTHLNDNTVAGIRMKSKPVFSVQFHPEASAGPHDSRYLFDDFIKLIKTQKEIETI